FASEGGKPAIFLPEQVEVLAHWVSWRILFFRSLQILALPRLLEGEIFHRMNRRRSLGKTQIDRRPLLAPSQRPGVKGGLPADTRLRWCNNSACRRCPFTDSPRSHHPSRW